MTSTDHARRMNGQVRGVSLSGKAGATLDRIHRESQAEEYAQRKGCSMREAYRAVDRGEA